MADGESAKVHRARHTASVAEATRAISDVMAGNSKAFGDAAQKYRALARKAMTETQIRKFVAEAFEVPDVEEIFPGIMARAQSRTEKLAEKRADEIVRLAEVGRGASLPGVRGTAWGAYNALTEYLAHEMRGSEASRVESLAMGGPASKISERGLEIALRNAA
jgi:hypothetical protein